MDSRISEFSPRKSRVLTQFKDVTLKVLVIGNFGVGKTAIVRRYTQGIFSANYKATIGADFTLKTLLHEPNTRVHLQLWDIAGNERFSFMTKIYYRHASACAIVFDVTRDKTFEALEKWLRDLHENVCLDDGSNIPVILLANKWDVRERKIKESTISDFCKKHNILSWHKTSAKTNLEISEAINSVVTVALKNLTPIQERLPEIIKIGETNNKKMPCCN